MSNLSSRQKTSKIYITVNIDHQSYQIDVNPKWYLSNIVAGYIRNQYFSQHTKIEEINAYIKSKRIDVKETFESILKKWEEIQKVDHNNNRQSKSGLVIRLIEKCDDPRERNKPNDREESIHNSNMAHQDLKYDKKKQRLDLMANGQPPEIQIKKQYEDSTNNTFNQASTENSHYAFSYQQDHSWGIHEPKEILVANTANCSSRFLKSQKIQNSVQIENVKFIENKKLIEELKSMMQAFTKQFGEHINFPQFSRFVEDPSYPPDELMQKFLDPIRIHLNKQIKGKSLLNQNWNNRIFETDNNEVVQQKIASASNKIQNFILKTQTFQNQLSCDIQQHLIRQLRNLTLKGVSSVQPLFTMNGLKDNNLKFHSCYNMMENIRGKQNILVVLNYETKNQLENLAIFNPNGIQYRKLKQIQHRNNFAKKVKDIDKFGYILDLKRQNKYIGERGSLVTLSHQSIEIAEGLLNLQCSNSYNISVKTRPKKVDEKNREFWSFISNQTNPVTSLELYQIIFQSLKT